MTKGWELPGSGRKPSRFWATWRFSWGPTLCWAWHTVAHVAECRSYMDSGASLHGCDSRPCHSLAVQPQASNLTSLYFHMAIITDFFIGLTCGSNELLYAKNGAWDMPQATYTSAITMESIMKTHNYRHLHVQTEETQVQCTQLTCPGSQWQCQDGKPVLSTLRLYTWAPLSILREEPQKLGDPNMEHRGLQAGSKASDSFKTFVIEKTDRMTYVFKHRGKDLRAVLYLTRRQKRSHSGLGCV